MHKKTKCGSVEQCYKQTSWLAWAWTSSADMLAHDKGRLEGDTSCFSQLTYAHDLARHVQQGSSYWQ